LREHRYSAQIQSLVGIKHRATFLKNYLNPMIAQDGCTRSLPNPEPSQQYRSTAEGRAWLYIKNTDHPPQ
jgi:hypothetical protein